MGHTIYLCPKESFSCWQAALKINGMSIEGWSNANRPEGLVFENAKWLNRTTIENTYDNAERWGGGVVRCAEHLAAIVIHLRRSWRDQTGHSFYVAQVYSLGHKSPLGDAVGRTLCASGWRYSGPPPAFELIGLTGEQEVVKLVSILRPNQRLEQFRSRLLVEGEKYIKAGGQMRLFGGRINNLRNDGRMWYIAFKKQRFSIGSRYRLSLQDALQDILGKSVLWLDPEVKGLSLAL